MDIVYHGPFIIDEPEEFTMEDFIRNALAMEVERLFYSNGRLFIIDYETLHGIVEDKFVIVELITYSSFTNVNEYKRWVLYHGHDDAIEYTDKIINIRGDTTIIPIVKTRDRFVRKIEEMISKGWVRKVI
uniref:Uncharacterized protein n=1 Tax=Geoglobus ahangari TaxID=113653 RepID=A0A7C4S563_9EURY